MTGNLNSFDIPILKNISLGLGVQSLYGFSNKYPKDGPFASVITRAQLPLLDIKPTIAYKFNERFSVGFGLDIFTFVSFMGEGRFVQHSIADGIIPNTIPGQARNWNWNWNLMEKARRLVTMQACYGRRG